MVVGCNDDMEFSATDLFTYIALLSSLFGLGLS